MKRGVPPTAPKARTGELTPPGVTACARAKSCRETSSVTRTSSQPPRLATPYDPYRFDVGPADLVDAVQPFDLGAVVDAPQLVARGAMGEVYRLDTTRGSYAIKRLFDWNPGDGADREASFTAVARDRGVSVHADSSARCDRARNSTMTINRMNITSVSVAWTV